MHAASAVQAATNWLPSKRRNRRAVAAPCSPIHLPIGSGMHAIHSYGIGTHEPVIRKESAATCLIKQAFCKLGSCQARDCYREVGYSSVLVEKFQHRVD